MIDVKEIVASLTEINYDKSYPIKYINTGRDYNNEYGKLERWAVEVPINETDSLEDFVRTCKRFIKYFMDQKLTPYMYDTHIIVQYSDWGFDIDKDTYNLVNNNSVQLVKYATIVNKNVIDTVYVQHNGSGDTRTCGGNVDRQAIQDATKQHIKSVSDVMSVISKRIAYRGINHDWTKITYEPQFFKDFCDCVKFDENFTSLPWYRKHIAEERHHLNDSCPNDVNLIDIIEMIVDCVTAGIARSGSVRNIEISDTILHKALQNTIQYITEIVKQK